MTPMIHDQENEKGGQQIVNQRVRQLSRSDACNLRAQNIFLELPLYQLVWFKLTAWDSCLHFANIYRARL